MCLIYVAHRVHPRYPLVVAANRDEFHRREAAPVAWWPDRPQVLAGRDLSAGGTWMGMSRSGRFAAITNFRQASARDDNARSRGELVLNFLISGESAYAYANQVSQVGNEYNGFTLLVLAAGELVAVSNRAAGVVRVTPGVHGLSNHWLDTPWPKVEHGKRDLLALLSNDAVEPQHLLALLNERQPASDEAFPDTGVGIERERDDSPRFILGEHYGTRCSTIVTLSDEGAVRYQERRFDHRGEACGDVVFEFSIDNQQAA